MFRWILSGCNGRMGRAVERLCAAQPDLEIVAGFDLLGIAEGDFPVFSSPAEFKGQADVVIDFSSPAALPALLDFCLERRVPVVLATTGYSQEQLVAIDQAARTIPIFRSANMSLGVNLLIELAKKAESVLGDGFDVEIVEMHHNQKIDAPSGTALMIADAINQVRENSMQYVYDRHSQRKKREKKEIGLHSVRGGSIVGEHQVIFAGQSEVLTLSHSAQSKELFAVGAVNAALFMNCKGPGLYDMSHLI